MDFINFTSRIQVLYKRKQKMEYWNTYKTKIGTLIIVEKENKISRIETVKANSEYPKGEKVQN